MMPSKTLKKQVASPDSGRENERKALKKHQKRVKVTIKEDTPKSLHAIENANIYHQLRREHENDNSIQPIRSILVSLEWLTHCGDCNSSRKRAVLNSAQAECCHQEDSSYLQNLSFQKHAHQHHIAATKFSPMAVEEWSLTLDYLLDCHTLKSIIAVMCMNNSAAPFKDDNPVWMKIELVIEMLLDIFADPLHFDVVKWIGVGTIVPSSEDIFKEYDLDREAETWMLSEIFLNQSQISQVSLSSTVE
ncbi:hypothetical protein JAAARDRAFT_692916 [Jaapia argillacea MUCL 33604]|uniref:Uncharacterized protein n=1 Tax=Jaapia argillacea MUCL 33604 TaxID=933084 RepID=A0A067PK97_9AGAM|nr:hypothetical protein JAAARDRAFT_692916 [Jaapia argillacea MUCL 33604]